jgi:hypothetical protein
LRLSNPAYPSKLRQAAVQAQALGVGLELAIFLSNNALHELAKLVKELERFRPPVCTWLIFHEYEKSVPQRWVELARDSLRSYDSAAKIGSGTDAYFYQLNQYRPAIRALDLVCYSIHPQEHNFDNISLVETLEVQAATVKNALLFSGQLPIAITPVTLRPRFNPNATGPQQEPAADELPSQVDVRQMSLFGAGWTAGSLKYLSENGVYSLTYYETSGWRGVMERETGSPLPAKFCSLPGSVFPLFHVLADAGEFAGGTVVSAQSSNPMRVESLAFHKEAKRGVLLANLSPERQRVKVDGLGGDSVWLRDLNEHNVESAMCAPLEFRELRGSCLRTNGGTVKLELLPFALVRLDEIQQQNG